MHNLGIRLGLKAWQLVRNLKAAAVLATLMFTGIFAAIAAPADIARGVTWLQTQVLSTGSLATESKTATAQQAQCETATTLLQLVGNNAQLASLVNGLQTSANTQTITESLACTQLLRQRLGQLNGNTDVFQRRLVEGGYSAYRGFGVSNALDTGWALAAQLGSLSTSEQGQLFNWLQSKQLADGSFTVNGTSNLLSTAIVLRGLKDAASQNTTAAVVAQKAVTYLLHKRANNAGWSNDVATTAIVFEAVHPYTAADPSVATAVETYLLGQQQLDGSWQSDAYVTAVALRALALVSAAPLNPTLAALKVQFVDARTAAPVPGVSFISTATSTSVLNGTSNASGQIELRGVAAGVYQLQATAPGYATVSLSINLNSGQTLDLGRVQMLVPTNPSTALLSGQVREQGSNQPIAGASVSVEGQNFSATTAADGSYLINNIAPGAISVIASKLGYLSVAGSATAQAGQVINFSPLLSVSTTTGTSTLADCKIQGVVLDAASQQPIAGVNVAINGSNTASTVTDANGRYSLAGLVSGPISVQASKAGYDSVYASTRLICSAIRPSATDFSPKLYAGATTPTNGNTAGLSGVIVNAGTNQAIAGAQMLITPEIGSARTLQTGPDGRFDAPSLDGAIVQVQIQASGYQGITLQYVLSPLQNFDIGQIRLRAPKVEQLLPDFKVVSVNRTNAITDPQTLRLSGTVEVQIVNVGNQTAPANATIIAFSDVNRNNTFDASGDVSLGQSVLTQALAPGQTATLQINVQSVQPFRDAPIHVVIDPNNQVAEVSKANNVRSTADAVQFQPSLAAFKPKLKWQWNGSSAYPSYNQVMMAPVVGRIIDTNGDGKIDELDTPSVVFTTFRSFNYFYEGVIRVVDGATGAELMSIVDDQDGVAGIGGLALADLDGDGKPEIIGMTQNGKVIVFRNNGQKLWTSTNVFNNQGNSDIWATPAVADINGDGKPAIVVSKTVLNADGSIRWQGQGSNCGCVNRATLSVSVVSDLFATGTQNVIVGGAVYSSSGQLLWEGLDGYAAIGDFEGNGEPAIVISGNNYNYVAMYNRTGQLKWRVALPGGGGGPPTIADADGDGRVDIGIAGSNAYTVLRGDGSVLWSKPSQDNSSQITGSTFFDFNGDGSSEVLYADELKMRAFQGGTGELLWSLPNPSGTALEYPVVADVDNDGHADFVLVANNYAFSGVSGVRVFQDENNQWLPARTVWNQHAYSINNINDDLTVPRNPVPSWQTHNTFRLNKRIDGDPRAIADLTVGYLRVTDSGSTGASTLTVRTGNAGSYKVPAGTLVAFYRSNPTLTTPTASSLIGTATISQELQPGQYQDINLQVSGNLSNLSPSYTIWIVGDDNGAGKNAIADFDRSNNTLSGDLSGIAVNVNVSVSTNQPVYNETEVAVFSAPVTNVGSFVRDAQVRLSVFDANGQLVEVLPLGAPITVAAGASVPVVQPWSVAGVLSGNYQVKAELITPQGVVYGSATASFVVQASQELLNSARISADRVNYSAAQAVLLSSRVTNASSNTVQDNVRAITEVFNSSGQGQFSQSEPIAQLSPNGQRTYSYSLPASTLPAGNYQARVQLLSAQGSVLAQSSTSFIVQDTSQTGIGLRGQLQATPSVVLIGQNVALNLQVNNNGNAALTNLPVTIRVLDPQSGTVLATTTQTLASLSAGQSLPVSATWTSVGLDGQILVAAATANLNGRDIALAQAQVRLQGVAQLSVTPATLDFGTATLSSNGQISPTASAQLVTVRSTGSAIAQSVSWSLGGTDTNAFQIQGGTCTQGMSLPVGASCTLSIGYQPSQAKAHQAQLRVSHANSGNILETVNLQGRTLAASTNAALSLSASLHAEARILVLVSCPVGQGNNSQDDATCVAERSQAISAYLNSLGILHKIVTDEPRFIHEMRCGEYNAYWISGGALKLSAQTVKEIKEAVWRGDGLITDGIHDSRNQHMHDAHGVKQNGKLPQSGYSASLSANSLFGTGTWATLGQPTKFDLQGGQSQANFNAAQGNQAPPAVISHQYGAGNSLLFAFDLADMLRQQANAPLSAQWLDLLRVTAGHVAPSVTPGLSLSAGDVIAVKLRVSSVATSTQSVNLQASVPLGVTHHSASLLPGSIGADQVNWNFSLPPGASQDIVWRLKVQEGITLNNLPLQLLAQSSQAGALAVQLQTLLSASVPPVASLTSAPLDALQALQISASADQNKKSKAISAAAVARDKHQQGKPLEAIAQWIEASDWLQGISSADTRAARTAIAWALEASTDSQCQALACLRGDIQLSSATPALGSILSVNRSVTNSCPAPIASLPVQTILTHRRSQQKLLSPAATLNLAINQSHTQSHTVTLGSPAQQVGDWLEASLLADWQGHRIELDKDTAQITASVTPSCPAGGTVSTSRFTPFAETERLEIRSGKPGAADWEWGLGANTQTAGQFTQANLDWLSGTSYYWTVTTDAAGKGTFTVRNGASVVAQGTYDKPAAKLRNGNAIRLTVKTASDAGAANIAASLLKIEGQSVSHSVITTAANQSHSLVITHPGLANGMTAEGTVRLDFTGSAPPAGSRLNFTLNAGTVQCP